MGQWVNMIKAVLATIVLLLPLLCATYAAANDGRFYRSATVADSYDNVYARVEKLREISHYGQSMQCIKYPSRGECAVYNSMANQNAYYIYIEPLSQRETRVAVYTTDLADKRAKQEIDDFLKQLKQGANSKF